MRLPPPVSKQHFFRVLLLWPLLTAVLGAAPATVQIKINAPQLESYSFPAGHPPVQIKSLEGIEAGLCDTQISCELRLAAEYPRFTLRNPAATVTSVEFIIGARITIWVQEGSPPAILEHEETHRAISEHYYQMAYAVARQISEKTVGQKLPLTGKPREQALTRAIGSLQPELIAGFMRQTSQRSEFAQERFDTITDHGRRKIPNDEAMAQAIREEAEHWKTQATNPAPGATR